ncbi:MAG: hypothetical protein IT371_06460 [Deltaproteobacteria bacterium]|nr:hypothetical protein [Deltaproteobacteria bacterium]
MLAVALPGPAHARRYPITKADESGTWIGTRRGLLHGVGELWKRTDERSGLPSPVVNDLELTPRAVWVATPRGLARLDKGSRRWETVAAPPLPSVETTSVSFDPSEPDQLWVGTAKGLAHYNVRTNSWSRVPDGILPAGKVHDVHARGRTVWVATDAGLAAYEPALGSAKLYSRQHSLPGDRVLELDELGQDLWLTCDGGLARMSLQRRTFAGFGPKQGLPGGPLLALARLENTLYVVTAQGLVTYDVSADVLVPFRHEKGLLGARVRAVAATGGYAWFATSQGLSRFDPAKKVWAYYKTEDGLSTTDARELTVAGSALLIFGGKGELDSYDHKKDEWLERTGLLGAGADRTAGEPRGAGPTSGPASAPSSAPARPTAPPRVKLSVSAELDTELKQDLTYRPTATPRTDREGYWLVNTLRLGAGAAFASGRKVDLSGSLDWGDISPLFLGQGATLRSFQRYELELRYLGLERDFVREALFGHQVRLEPSGGPLTERTELEGGRLVLSAGPPRAGGRFATLQATAGVRRGTPLRLVLRRPSVESLQVKRLKLSRPGPDGTPRELRYVIPQSVRVLLDGRELERNVDYFMDHENGVLWLRNTDLLHPTRVVEVELEYEQIPRKNVGAVAMTDLLPRDGTLGQLKRTGRARWAKDEQGLFDEIDGGADQFINRGWVKTLSQDFEWGSSGVSLRIYDMGDDKNAGSIFIVRKLPEAKPVPGMDDVFVEKQTAGLTVKLVRGSFYVEVSIDQASQEQELLSIAGWLVSKLSASGGTSADQLRDLIGGASLDLKLTDRTQVGLAYYSTRSLDDPELRAREKLEELARDVFSAHAQHVRPLGKRYRLDARLQGAGSQAWQQGYVSGAAVDGRLLVSGPRLVLSATGRKFTPEYLGLGVARQTEFCRTATRQCVAPFSSHLDYEAGLESTVRPASFLPVRLAYQRQVTRLGEDYADAPAGGPGEGSRDVASAQVTLDRAGLPRLSVGADLLRRADPFARQLEWRASSALEADLAGHLRALRLKKLFLRGLYEHGQADIDERRRSAGDERDRHQVLHHAVGELRLAPTLTENAYATVDLHRLRGVLDASGELADQLTYWRLDAGASSGFVRGLALRFDSTLWFGDDRPLVSTEPGAPAAATLPPVDPERNQQADSRLSGILDLFPGEWLKRLGPLKFSGAYTYTRQAAAQGRIRATVARGVERCDVVGDEDGDGLADCADPDCALADQCLLRTSRLESHRGYGTLSWDTPGKLFVELFGDLRWGFSDRDRVLRSTRQELRSQLVWRPIYPSPITARFDLVREMKRPDQYDGILPAIEAMQTVYEPALEWRRRWSPRWWHWAKLALSVNQFRDLPHIRTVEDAFGKKGDLERRDYDQWALKPSLEVRRRFEDPQGRFSVRPYARATYKLQWGSGLRSRIDSRECRPGDPCLANGSETSQTYSLSVGAVWVHAENLFIDLDLTGSYYDCIRPASGALCQDKFLLTPHLLARVRY